ncbi:hypothetical protein [Limosilactobacillus reuteri]|nr:hypothetical protein [Limosilactobacillus reuteri]
MVTPLKTLMGFSVHLNVQLKFYNLPIKKDLHDTVKDNYENGKYDQQIESGKYYEKSLVNRKKLNESFTV